MKFVKFIFRFIGLFIVSIPIVYLNAVIVGEMTLNPSKREWIVFLVIVFIATIGSFIIENYFKRKQENKTKSDRDKSE